jgi:hypothetical protein
MIETGLIVAVLIPIYALLFRIEHRLTVLECGCTTTTDTEDG